MKKQTIIFIAIWTALTGCLFAQDRNIIGPVVQSGYVPDKAEYTASTDTGSPKPWNRLRGYINTLNTNVISNDITLFIDDASVMTGAQSSAFGAYINGGLSNGVSGNITVEATVNGLATAHGIYSNNALYGNFSGNITVKGANTSYGLLLPSGMATGPLTLSISGKIEAIGKNASYAISRTGNTTATRLAISFRGASGERLSATLENGGLGYAIYSENSTNTSFIRGVDGGLYSITGNIYSHAGFDIEAGAYVFTSDTWAAAAGKRFTLYSGSSVYLEQSLNIDAETILSQKAGSTLNFGISDAQDYISIDLGGGNLEVEAGCIINLMLDDTYALLPGDSFDLYTDVSTVTGTLGNIDVRINGVSIDLGEIYQLRQNGSNIVFSMAPIPEPSTYAILAGLAIMAFAALRRSRR
ncbi:PEP-CTERM putative exosortase interaction domain-containing protein [Opitutaceae bacterium TAV1]|nr:PEP-CTERM putative exosortase interaction domain-containing protein [Opitutaceae bacterium TAV1]